MKTSKVQDIATDTLQANLGAMQAEYNSGHVEFKNSKGEPRKLPYNRVDRNGAFVGDRETEMEAWDLFTATAFKAQHEQKRAVNGGNANLAVKAGHSIKLGVASMAVRASRMPSTAAEVTVQLARAQKLAKGIRDIQTELARRTEEAKVKAEAEVKAKVDADIASALMGGPSLARALVSVA